jgi:hypothetical protein
VIVAAVSKKTMMDNVVDVKLVEQRIAVLEKVLAFAGL